MPAPQTAAPDDRQASDMDSWELITMFRTPSYHEHWPTSRSTPAANWNAEASSTPTTSSNRSLPR